jgi:hypothetical protein
MKDRFASGEFESLCCIDIAASVEIITREMFFKCRKFREMIFGMESQVLEIHGFHDGISRCRIDIPRSTGSIGKSALCKYSEATEWFFAVVSRVREIDVLSCIKSFWRMKSEP